MPKFAPEGSPYIPWTIDADQIGGVDVEQGMSPALNDVLTFDGTQWTPAAGGGGGVPATRLINTTAPLAGGGDLSADRTLTVATFGAGASGVVPASGGGTTNFLRADGTWQAPPGTGVTSVGASAPVTSSGGLTPTIGVTDFSAVARGTVPASGGGSTNYLRADGTWTAPPGTGVTSVSGTAPISSSGGATPAISLDDNGVSNAKLRDSGALSVIGRSANSLGDPADISAVAASGAVLRESGSTLGFGQIATAGITDNAVTLAKLATQANYTWLGNISGGVAVPTATALVISTTTDPTITDDSAAGRFVGQRWVNTTGDRSWVCVDTTVGAAIWRRESGPPQTFQTNAGTQALYRFDGNGNDSGGAAINLVAAGSPAFGYGLGSRQFYRGTSGNNYSVASNPLNLSSSMSIEMLAFARPNPSSAYVHTFVQYGPNASRRYWIDFANATGATWATGYYTGAVDVSISTTAMTETWNYVVMTRTVSGGNTTLTLYVNGIQAATDARAATPSSANSSLYVGRNATGATTQILFGEYIGGIHITTTVLSAAQIRQNAQLYLPTPTIGN